MLHVVVASILLSVTIGLALFVVADVALDLEADAARALARRSSLTSLLETVDLVDDTDLTAFLV